MTWDDLECELHAETKKLEGARPELSGMYPHEQAQALLALEALHHVALTKAVHSRVGDGEWPPDLTSDQRYLLMLRVLWLEQHIVWFEVWGGDGPQTVEQFLTVFADREWHRFRYSMHVDRLTVGPSSVDDPFADHVDPWSQ